MSDLMSATMRARFGAAIATIVRADPEQRSRRCREDRVRRRGRADRAGSVEIGYEA